MSVTLTLSQTTNFRLLPTERVCRRQFQADEKGRKFSKRVENTVGKEIARYEQFLLFSSPEHKVLMVSFCDRPMSGVRRPSCLVHNFFKHLLLLNHLANLDETWQGCSLGEALPKRLNSNHNSCCHGNQKEKKIAKSLKIF